VEILLNTRPLRFVLCLAVVALVLAGCSGGHHSTKELVVSITNPITTITPGGAFVTLNATVTNDGSTPGVSWTLVNTGTSTACTPACGALSGNTTTSVVYTPPATIPSPATVSIVATSNSDSTKTSIDSFTIQNAVTNSACQISPALRGNESALTQPIAFLVKGSDSDDAPIAFAGSVTPDGEGGFTAGAIDIVSYDEGTGEQAVTTGSSSYSYGSDGRGCFSISFEQATNAKHPASARKMRNKKAHARNGANAAAHSAKSTRRASATQVESDLNSVVFSFSLLDLSGPGRIIEFDNPDGSGTISAGQIHVQTPAAFSVGSLASNFAFGMDGWVNDEVSGIDRMAIAGSFANAGGTFSNGFADEVIADQVSGELNGGSGSIGGTDTNTGRGQGSYSSAGDGGFTFDFVYYVVNGSDFYILSADDPNDGDPMLSGRALKSSAESVALNGWYITALTGLNCDQCGESEGNNYVSISTLHATNALAATGTYFINDGESFQTNAYTGTYTLDATAGRIAFSNTGSNAVGYLTATTNEDDIAGFLVGTDANAAGGFIAFQASTQPDFGNNTIGGNYAFGTAEDVVGQNGTNVGVFNITSGSYTGVIDSSLFDDPQQSGQTGSGSYVVNTDGSGIFNPSTDNQVNFVTSGALILGLDAEGGQPLLYVWIQAPQETARRTKAKTNSKTVNK
jgi:hypothetical protein